VVNWCTCDVKVMVRDGVTGYLVIAEDDGCLNLLLDELSRVLTNSLIVNIAKLETTYKLSKDLQLLTKSSTTTIP